MAEEEAVQEDGVDSKAEDAHEDWVNEKNEDDTGEDVEEDGEETPESEPGDDEGEDEEGDEEVDTVEKDPEPIPETYKLKVYGKEIEVDKDQLINLAQKGTAADKNLSQVEQQRKELIQVIEDFKDPTKVIPLLSKLGHNPRKMMEDYLYEEYKKEEMTPEQKQALEWKQRAEALEAEKQRGETTKKQQEILAQQEAIKGELDASFTKALEGSSIPKTKESVAKMAYYMEAALLEGSEITPEESAALVEQDMKDYYGELIEKATPEQLIGLFGENVVQKVEKYKTSKIKTPEDKNKLEKPVKSGKKTKKSRKTHVELKKQLDEMFGGDPFDIS
jgi:hypothetical protein